MTAAPFDVATAVEAVGDGRYAAAVDPGWLVVKGANGGVVAATMLRAMTAAVGDPARAPRSLTCHYLRPPEVGPIEIATTVERAGRSLTTVTARMEQHGRPAVLAIGAFAAGFESAAAWSWAMPPTPPAASVAPRPVPDQAPPIAHRFTMRKTVGEDPWSGGDEARIGGWMALDPPQRLDAEQVACLLDAFLPAAFVRVDRPVFAPTIDLTIHFRTRLPVDADQALGIFTTQHAEDGLIEEDGALWAPDGRLLAHSRQLALLRPL